MPESEARPRPATARDLLFLWTPRLWPAWPFLPLVRRHPGGATDYGVLYDCWSAIRSAGK
jgi:hypothetical protein